MFFAPILFSSLGSGRSAALLNTVVIGVGEGRLPELACSEGIASAAAPAPLLPPALPGAAAHA